MLQAFFYSERARHSPWRLLNSSSCRPHLSACCRTIVSDWRLVPQPLKPHCCPVSSQSSFAALRQSYLNPEYRSVQLR
jgi:hypothetical protein